MNGAPNHRSLRVIQWATGNIGARAMAAVIDHPDLELAGVWVSTPAKAGYELAPGIVATTDAAALIATPADCVLYMRQGTDIDELCALLQSGKNVVTTRGDFHHPPMMPADARARIEAACAAGGTSIYSTGSSPGFVTEALPIALLSLSRRLDCLTVDEFADLASRNSPQLLFDIMRFGQPMGPFDQGQANHLKGDFASSLAQLAAASGVVIDEWEAQGEYSPATRNVAIAAGTIEKGTIGAMRISIVGRSGGHERLRFRAHWYATREIAHTDWALRESGWRVDVAGDTPVRAEITFPVPPEDYAAFSPGLTAHRAVNAVAAVCAAAPGIRTTADLPQVIARLGA